MMTSPHKLPNKFQSDYLFINLVHDVQVERVWRVYKELA